MLIDGCQLHKFVIHGHGIGLAVLTKIVAEDINPARSDL